jgi:secreted PhoX family phosphatase
MGAGEQGAGPGGRRDREGAAGRRNGAPAAGWRRRELIGAGLGGVTAVALGTAFWDELFGTAESRPLRRGPGYGPLGPPDELGFRLPPGFRSRLVARGGEPVAGTGYEWHLASDGMATFHQRDGSFVLVSNAEAFEGGASAIRFDRHGRVEDAYRVLSGTTQNCSGGGTPWGTWLSCEEVEQGRVWECDPSGRKRAVAHPAMGVFKHEAAAVDAPARRVYLTEDLIDGGLYRYTPKRWPDLSAGLLEIARVSRGGAVAWVEVPDPLARRERTRRQVPGSARFERGEGIWLDGDTLWVATTADHRVHAYDTRRERIRVAYDGLASRSAPLLRVDQLTGSRAGEVFVCEDLATDEIDVGVIAPDRSVSKFLSVTGPQHVRSELTGVTFDPSGTRMFVASQRAFPSNDVDPGPGAVYEVSGPFKGRAVRRRPT